MNNSVTSQKDSLLTTSSYFTEIHQNQNPLLCSFNNKATHACQNKECNKNVFLCFEQKCDCSKEHEDCFKVSLKSLIKNIQSKRVFIDSLETCINNGVEQMINLLSKYRDDTISKIKKDFEFFGLNENQKLLMKEIKNGKCEKTTGKTVSEIITHSKRQKQSIITMVERTCKSLENNFKRAKQSFEQTLKDASLTITSLDSEVLKFFKTVEIKNSLINLEVEFSFSKIFSSLYQLEMIATFFDSKKIKSAKLIYRASQNNFQAQKFHQKCDGVSDTLTLVETEFSKKIGGYIPIKWSNPQSWKYVKDDSMSSFLFSLTNGDKFQLTNKEKAVQHYSGYGPTFGGGHDLCICDKANENTYSFTQINDTYKNDKYEYDQQSWTRFNGATSSIYFKVKQWQVWSLQFF